MNQVPTSEIVQTSLARKFQTNLEDYKSEVDALAKMVLNNGVDFIYDHCQNLRTNVHLAIEYRIEELHNIGDD